MTRPTRAVAAAGLGLLLSGCASAPELPVERAAAVVTPSAAAPASTAGPSRPAGPRPAATPATSASPSASALALALTGARAVGPVLPASAGALVDADVPGASQALNVDVAFSGVELGPGAGGERVVGYPTLQLQAAFDGTVVAHVKLARFTCPPGTSPATGCTGRTVDYGDADARSTSVEVADDGVVTVEVTAAAYRYGAGVDRTAGVRPRPTGERIRMRAVITPGELLSRRGRSALWRPLAEVSGVTAARPGSAVVPSGRALQDDGYPNAYRAVLDER